jgi:acetyl esterase
MSTSPEIRIYATVAGRKLEAHIFCPERFDRSERRAVYAFFHPGGWSMGDPSMGYSMCQHYVSLGMVAVSFGYRLSSIGGFTPAEAVADVKSAIRWTRQQADELGIGRERLVAGGWSAGGHLALCSTLGLGANNPEDDLSISTVPNALILQCPCVNTASDQHFVELLQGVGKPEHYSPSHNVRVGLPPMCLGHGANDQVVAYTTVTQFADDMRAAGNRCELETFEGGDHFFSRPSDQDRLIEAFDAFLSDLGHVKARG